MELPIAFGILTEWFTTTSITAEAANRTEFYRKKGKKHENMYNYALHRELLNIEICNEVLSYSQNGGGAGIGAWRFAVRTVWARAVTYSGASLDVQHTGLQKQCQEREKQQPHIFNGNK